jgi:putative transposase
MKDWFSATELASRALPGMPSAAKNVREMAEARGWLKPELEGSGWRMRAGRGGGVEFRLALLPTAAQAALMLRERGAAPAARRTAAAPSAPDRDARWAWFERLPEKKQAVARTRLEALDAAETLVLHGVGRVAAMQEVARLKNVRLSTLYEWRKLVDLVPRADWLAHLAPHHTGRSGDRADCGAEAWEMIKADWLRPEKPTFTACYRRLEQAAAERGWTIPAARTLERRLLALPTAVRVLARDGVDSLKRMIPAQQRDRAGLHAMQVVNADGHKWDVFVKWPNGDIARPMMLAFQDIHSGKILAWRVDRSENRETFRLCFGDLVEEWGIPDACVLDNSRTFASKWMTGGTANRFRFKVKDDEPLGIMTQLGVQVHWATPYAGQSKPIERAFRDLAGDVAKHPAFAGAYTGNTPMAKPENYASTAVPLDAFLATVAGEIVAHNARTGRTGGVALGRSFDQVFLESYAASPIRQASAHQRRLWLLAAERQLVSRTDGSITLLGNRFFADFLHEHRGERVTVRFDPELLQQPLHIYRADGDYLGSAECIEAAGFLDAGAARQHAQARKAWLRGVKMQLAAERTLSIRDVAALLPQTEAPAPKPEPKIIRPVFGNTALAPRVVETPNEQPADELALIRAMRRLSVVRTPEDGGADD